MNEYQELMRGVPDLDAIASLGNKIGEGWAGEVYKGFLKSGWSNRSAGHAVAVKLYKHVAAARDPLFARRVSRELRLSMQVRSDRLVCALGTAIDRRGGEERLCLVMDLIEGNSLGDAVKTGWPLPVDEMCQIAEDIRLALEALHQNDVIHRDVKPHNIMVARGRATLMDLGVAKTLLQPGETQSKDFFLGTIRYADRAYLLEGVQDLLIDSWSMGMCLFEMLYGHAPYNEAKVFSQCIVAIEKGVVNCPSGALRFGEALTLDHLRLEALMFALLAKRESRLTPAGAHGWHASSWPPARKRLLQACGESIERIHDAVGALVYPCLGLCYARLQRNCSEKEIEMLALLPAGQVDIDSLRQSPHWLNVLRNIETTGAPTVKEFADYDGDTKLEVVRAVSHWLASMYGPGEDVYGRYSMYGSYFREMEQAESDPTVRAELKRHADKLEYPY